MLESSEQQEQLTCVPRRVAEPLHDALSLTPGRRSCWPLPTTRIVPAASVLCRSEVQE
jgi:hypothetical protein